MMAATSAMTAVNPFIQANAADASGKSNAESSTISSNDFLTLLVTEMKNQDPTAQTDPNEYVNQLVQVNSLQQLIEINENISGALTHSSGGTNSGTGKSIAGRLAAAPDQSSAATWTGKGGTSHPIAVSGTPVPAVSGNIGIPASTAAAYRVAHALSGRK